MKFKMGQKVTFNGFAMFGETGSNWVGRIGRHHYKKSNRLVVRGEIPGETGDFELYFSRVKPYLQLPMKKLKRYPRADVIAYARKMNTPANARKMAWIDSGPYIVSNPKNNRS